MQSVFDGAQGRSAWRGSPITGIAGGVSGGAVSSERSSDAPQWGMVPAVRPKTCFPDALTPEERRFPVACSVSELCSWSRPGEYPQRRRKCRTQQACMNHVGERLMPFLFHFNALCRNRRAPVLPGLFCLIGRHGSSCRQSRAHAPASSNVFTSMPLFLTARQIITISLSRARR